MFYDLNIPYTTNTAELQRTLAFLAELDYTTLALNHTHTGKLPSTLTSPLPPISSLPFPLPTTPNKKPLRLLRRCTLILNDPSQNHRLPALAASYDILALRPTSEKTLAQACAAPDVDLVSLDLSVRYPFHFKHKMFSTALSRGVKFEICYGAATIGTSSMGSDGGKTVAFVPSVAGDGFVAPSDAAMARRNLIANATGLIRALRGRGVVVSSEARTALAVRGPWDVVNLAAVWGLGQERGREAVGSEARSVVVQAEMRRRAWRGVVDVVYGGEGRMNEEIGEGKKGKEKEKGKSLGKRKAEERGSENGLEVANGGEAEKPISKREMKRRAKKAKLDAAQGLGKEVLTNGQERITELVDAK